MSTLGQVSVSSCKYKSSKPSIVERIYQGKDNFITEKQISIIKEKENVSKKSGKNYSQKATFSPDFYKIQHQRIPKDKRKIDSTQYPV